MNQEAIEFAEALRVERFAQAKAFFVAGSTIRDEDTPHSDLDVVVVFDHLDAAYRESVVVRGKRVEAFVHDPDTLAYFFHEVDRVSGIPSLPAMVSEGIELPAHSSFSSSLKRMAQSVLDLGPPPWDAKTTDASRYRITNLVDDLRDPRSPIETIAIGAELYSALADHYFRSRGLWSALGKTIPKRLAELDPNFSKQFEASFLKLFQEGEPGSLINLAERVLERDGGWLFEGYYNVAPDTWRSDGSEA